MTEEGLLQNRDKKDIVGKVLSRNDQGLVSDSKAIAIRVTMLQLGASGTLAGALLANSTLLAYSAMTGGIAIILANLTMTYFALRQVQREQNHHYPGALVAGSILKMLVLAIILYTASVLYSLNWGTAIAAALIIQITHVIGWYYLARERWQ